MEPFSGFGGLAYWRNRLYGFITVGILLYTYLGIESCYNYCFNKQKPTPIETKESQSVESFEENSPKPD